MKITQRFVAVQADGYYLSINHSQTHTGYRINVSPVVDIDDATIRNQPAPRDQKEADALNRRLLKITWVPVEVRREVILKGFGT